MKILHVLTFVIILICTSSCVKTLFDGMYVKGAVNAIVCANDNKRPTGIVEIKNNDEYIGSLLYKDIEALEGIESKDTIYFQIKKHKGFVWADNLKIEAPAQVKTYVSTDELKNVYGFGFFNIGNVFDDHDHCIDNGHTKLHKITPSVATAAPGYRIVKINEDITNEYEISESLLDEYPELLNGIQSDRGYWGLFLTGSSVTGNGQYNVITAIDKVHDHSGS